MLHNHHREQNIRTAVFLNVFFTIVEVVGGLWTNSLAILSDALHDFGDSIALITSWFAERKARQLPDRKRTFGYGRVSLFAALFAAAVLVVGSLFILSKAVPRLLNPEHVNAPGMMWLAFAGMAINGIGMFRLKKGESMNERVLSWHLLEDVLGWAVIFIGSIIMLVWDTPRSHIIDPIMTIGFTMFIFWGVIKNLKETLNIFLQGVPAHINIKEVEQALLNIPGVRKVHDVHIWSMEGEVDVFSGHVVVDSALLCDSDQLRKQMKTVLADHHIEHSTIEIETESFCSGIECENGLSGKSH